MQTPVNTAAHQPHVSVPRGRGSFVPFASSPPNLPIEREGVKCDWRLLVAAIDY